MIHGKEELLCKDCDDRENHPHGFIADIARAVRNAVQKRTRPGAIISYVENKGFIVRDTEVFEKIWIDGEKWKHVLGVEQ